MVVTMVTAQYPKKMMNTVIDKL